MPTETPVPRSIEAWLKQLDAVPLPVPSADLEQLQRTLGDERRSLREIAEQMQDSPTLALHVLREANRHTGSLGEPAESLELALTRLGLKRVAELLKKLPSAPETQIPPALRQLQLISLHASQQANGLFAARLARLWQEIHWGSLLFLAPLWPVVTAHPELLEAWERRVLTQNEPAIKVERELLGVPLLRLCLALAERWHLPDWIVQSYRLLVGDHRLLVGDHRLLVKALHIARDNEHPLHQQQMLDADSPLRRWLTRPSNTILLANGLALSAHDTWSGPHSLRWQRLAGLYLQLPLPDVQQQVHQQAAQSARRHARTGLWHPGEALLWPWAVRRLQPAPGPAATPKAEALSDWRRHCAELLREPSPFANVLQLTACARDALQACGLHRALVLLADRSHSRLLAQQALGLPKEAGGLSLDPNQSQVLRRLLTQPAQLRLTPANVAQFSALLPGTLKALFPSEHLLLRSLANNGRVVMLLIADQGGAPLAETSVQAFGKTAQCIERALGNFAKRR